jgi:hypothetical protein
MHTPSRTSEQRYICHQCCMSYVPSQTVVSGDVIWAACTNCDAEGRCKGEPDFDCRGAPRLNVITYRSGSPPDPRARLSRLAS